MVCKHALVSRSAEEDRFCESSDGFGVKFTLDGAPTQPYHCADKPAHDGEKQDQTGGARSLPDYDDPEDEPGG